MDDITLTLIGGPTAIIEVCGLRLLTDPTFDPPGEYQLPHVRLRKTSSPALAVEQIGRVDAVLLSHDQHADNLDTSGRAFLDRVPRVFTTKAGAARLSVTARGLAAWERTSFGDDRRVTIVATPARHGPPGIEPLSGDVIGFMLTAGERDLVYVTGDTVWFDGVAEVARRHSPRVVVVFAGAAKTRGSFHLTMSTNDVLETAHAFAAAIIVPIHCEGWAHFTESRADLEAAFRSFGLESRLASLTPGSTFSVPGHVR